MKIIRTKFSELGIQARHYQNTKKFKKFSTIIDNKIHILKLIRIQLSAYCLLAGCANRTPGIIDHIQIIKLYSKLFFKSKLSLGSLYNKYIYPMDSVRYFEFDFFRKKVYNKNVCNYLDISSPRLLFALLKLKKPETEYHILNPDERDLETTRKLIKNIGNDSQFTYHGVTIDNFDFPDNSFDMITSISVIEHIPKSREFNSVKKIWDLLQPNGVFIVSVPCAAEQIEEYIDRDFYGLYEKDKKYIFGQRFYDQFRLEDVFFKIFGLPNTISFFGEKKLGTLFELRKKKIIMGSYYPYWQEPYIIGKLCQNYNSISDMPGMGVVAMEFTK